VGNGVSAPQLILKWEPAYSAEAQQAKWQGSVGAAVVVDENGNPSNIRIFQPLGMGLD